MGAGSTLGGSPSVAAGLGVEGGGPLFVALFGALYGTTAVLAQGRLTLDVA